MSKPEITPWFQESVKPVHVGVYETNASGQEHCFQFWNGEFWGFFCSTKWRALKDSDFRSIKQNVSWRGLTKQATK